MQLNTYKLKGIKNEYKNSAKVVIKLRVKTGNNNTLFSYSPAILVLLIMLSNYLGRGDSETKR